jgi:UDP-2,4-diacetamido-2,4,6-trideoxy-beta-L-altropyranose hydrolase
VNPPSTVFRVDASSRIGGGHVSRCLALAGALRAFGHRSLFVCRPHAGHLGARIRDAGFDLAMLPPAEPAGSGAGAYAEWIGASAAADAEQTRSVIQAAGGRPEWLVVDHYGLDADWEQSVSAIANGVLVIDDLADRSHDCDVLVDQNLVANMASRYSRRVPERTAQLLGPRFALLGEEFARLHPAVVPRTAARRMLAFFGASDAPGLCGRLLQALSKVGDLDLEVDLVLPLVDQREPEAVDGRVTVHRNLPSLAALMAAADFAIGAGGVANWERLCMGLPSLVVATAENQRQICEELARRELIDFLGWHEAVDSEAIALALAQFVARGSPEAWSGRCLETVDGLGASRVAARMVLGAAQSLRCRPAVAADEARLLEWANDPSTRRYAFSPARISPEGHAVWFAHRLGHPEDCRIFLLESDQGVAVGQVRFEREDRAWVISYSVAPAFRGLGLGERVLTAGLRQMAGIAPGDRVVGLVKPENLASVRIFQSLGFASRTLGQAMEFGRQLGDFL